MKLLLSASSIAVAITLTLASTQTLAKNVVLKPSDQSVATLACYAAATESLNAAKVIVRENGINFGIFRDSVKCNGLSLNRFAKKYSVQADNTKPKSETLPEVITRVALVPQDANVESQLCLDAVEMGERAARSKHAIRTPVLCNNLNLADFIRSFSQHEVMVRNTVE
jgi:hypothetical protein